MKKNILILFLFVITLNSCHKKKTVPKIETIALDVKIPELLILKTELELDPNKGIWSYNNLPFNGFAISYHKNNILKEKIGFYKGKKQGISKKWHSNGKIRVLCYYQQNKLTNQHKTFRINGMTESECFYVSGKKEGIEKYWHPNGQLAKERTLKNGKENGLQRAWLNNGKIYVNYEAKNGRVFGLKRANLCYKLSDEKITLTNK